MDKTHTRCALSIAVGITMLALLLAGGANAVEHPANFSAMDNTRTQDLGKIYGRVNATGTHFELTGSSNLNFTLDSSEPIKLVLNSAPGIVTMHFKSASGAASTKITLSGFSPKTPYYKYEDGYHNYTAFTTDAYGNYSYTQDLSKPHLAFISLRPNTYSSSSVNEEMINASRQKHGRLNATGTHFELINDSYLNISMESSEPVKLVLDSSPKMVTMHFKPASGAASTQISLSGFAPKTTYYKYEDGYHNHTAFTTDSLGNYSYTQDLSKPHLAFISSSLTDTLFINDNANGGDCTLVGTWVASTKTCTLTTDVTKTIQIDSDGITLTGNGHSVYGQYSNGIFLSGRTGVTIQNMWISDFMNGIYLSSSNNNTLSGNYFQTWDSAIILSYSSNNILDGNFMDGSAARYGQQFFISASGNNNTLSYNLCRETGDGMYVSGDYNTIIGNVADYTESIVGISVSGSNNLLEGNDASGNMGIGGGIVVGGNDNIIRDNIANMNNIWCYCGTGISIGGNNNTISNNIADGNQNDVSSWPGSGIYLYGINNTLNNNEFLGNDIGIYLLSNNNTINGNTIESNKFFGIFLGSAFNNTIYNNSFNNINNINNPGLAGNYWNITKKAGKNIVEGPSIGGNFWAYPNGTGFSQTCTDGNDDGICDSSYMLDSNNADKLPLAYYIAIPINSCTTISSPGKYMLNQSILNSTALTCINITSSDVILEGAGFTLDGTDAPNTYGIYVYNATKSLTNVTVKNVIVTDWSNGIYYRNASNGNIANNILQSNNNGIYLYSSNLNNVTNNNISNSTSIGLGIYSSSKNNTIRGNNVSYSKYGFFISYSFNTTASGNVMKGNGFNFGVGGNLQTHFDGNSINTSNLADSKPIYYVKSAKDSMYDASTNAGTFYCILCNNVTIKGLNLSNMDKGVYFWSTSNSLIQNINVKESGWGLVLSSSYNNTIKDSAFSTNNVYDYQEIGIEITGSSNNNTVLNNTISSNNYGVIFSSSKNNTIYDNIFNNTNNYLFTDIIYSNNWNITNRSGTNIIGGPYKGGNFWAHPSGTGFSQICIDANKNGICDTGYTLASGNVDYLPLTIPVGYGYIYGTVLNNTTGIAGATVVTNTSNTTNTDASGRYSILVPAGTYKLIATSEPGFYPNSSITVTVATRTSVVQAVELIKKPTGIIIGNVRRI